ncbi:MAG: type 4a pilus biogenesis protein PilO [Candidatus Aminicenantes bacterium]|nr:type 4a pilus biogenesis protein PilO [Candidatus Aminicenantes bacterium]
MDLQSLPWYGQFLVFLAIGGLAFALFYFMMYSGTQDQIRNMNVRIDKLDKEIRAAEQKERKLPQLEAEVKRQEAVLTKLKEILPERNEIAGIIKKIESILAHSRLKIHKWSRPIERAQQIYIEHQLSIEVEGAYHNLGVFFDQLSRIKKIFNVDSLNIRPTQSRRRSEFTIKATFKASTYTYHEGKMKKRRGRGRGR